MNKNDAIDMFWRYHRSLMGFNPDEPMTYRETMYWREIRKIRKKCKESNDFDYAIKQAPSFDKQMFLAKWWDKMERHEKEEYLTYVWLNKGISWLYRYTWWFPYFEDTGFITNCDIEKPVKDIVLYRGAYPSLSYGLSWTPKKEHAELFSEQDEAMNVYQATVKPENILGIFYGTAAFREEPNKVYGIYEYVVDYRKIESIR